MVGKTISHYKILEKIGEGGMGEVFLAQDTSLDRKVALKFLPDFMREDPTAKKRFLREAKSAAALDHPYICKIYEVGEEQGRDFISMEYVQGTTLKDKLAKGPLALKNALEKATEIAEALEAAHKKNIVHRDLKPANIMLTADGHVKVMDFGLAKQLFPAGDVDSQEQTLTASLTKTGMTLGTPAYMSPAQLRGEVVDTRSDIFSFGIVLYEMLPRVHPFKKAQAIETAHAILNEAPAPLSEHRDPVPSLLQHTLRKMLAKEPERRYQHMDDVRIDLEELLRDIGDASAAGIGIDSSAGTARQMSAPLVARRWQLAIPSALLAVALSVSLTMWLRTPEPAPDLPLRKFTFTLKETPESLVISPDGGHIAYVTGTRDTTMLWMQDLDRDEARLVAGPVNFHHPFWSPDSDFLGFTTKYRELSKVSVGGGPAITICPTPGLIDSPGAWSADGRSIVFVTSTMFEVPSQGGAPRPLFEQEKSEEAVPFRHPLFLPGPDGSRRLIGTSGKPGEPRIVALDLDTGRREDLAAGERPAWSPTGHVLYESSGVLWAIAFSPETFERTGEPFPIRENASHASVATDGTLVHLGIQEGRQQLVWRDRSGRETGVIGQSQQQVMMPVLAPDGGSVVVLAREGTDLDIWIHDVARELKRPLTFGPVAEDRPIWSAKGDKVVFASTGAGTMDIFTQAADGSGEPEALVAAPGGQYPYDWSPDGRYLVYGQSSGTGTDILYLRFNQDGAAHDSVPFVATPFGELAPDLSPDGRFLAYESNKSGRYEIYVRLFPEGGAEWQVSTNGGRQPRWRGDARELFYIEEADTLVAVSVTTNPSFSVGAAKRLFADEEAFVGRGHRYDVSPDGQRFVLVKTVEPARPAIHVVQNWFAEFRDRQK